jgi:glutathione S-transferase
MWPSISVGTAADGPARSPRRVSNLPKQRLAVQRAQTRDDRHVVAAKTLPGPRGRAASKPISTAAYRNPLANIEAARAVTLPARFIGRAPGHPPGHRARGIRLARASEVAARSGLTQGDPMKLYLSPGACSLADHIALHEADLDFDRVKVDLKTKQTEDGKPFDEINPKSYVPVLEFDDGKRLTENIAILSWVAQRAPHLAPAGEHGQLRLLEMLAFISTEIHKQFGRVFRASSDAEESAAREKILQRFGLVAKMMQGDYLFGDKASVADAYLFTMLTWARKVGVEAPAKLQAFYDRMRERPAVKLAFEHEGLE